MPQFPPPTVQQAMVSPRWAGLVRTNLTPAEIATWNPAVLRESRALVPVDVQAMYVPAGDTTKYVRLPFALTTPDGKPAEAMPDPLVDGVTRPAGVYLHWAPPDALLNGTLQDVNNGTRNRLSMPALPDRWVVLRILAPNNASQPVVTGWVLEADTAKAIPLANWPAASAATAAEGKTVAPDQLTGTVGGSASWAGVYDAVHNRLSFYDPLTDVAAAAPAGAFDDCATYMVAGWWSDAKLDPLYGAETEISLSVRLANLKWALISDAEGGDQVNQNRTIAKSMRDSIGLTTADRYGTPPEATVSRTVAEPLLAQASASAKPFTPGASRFADNAIAMMASEPRWPRTTMLQGVVHGVPVTGAAVSDSKPDPSAVDLALGRHGDDVASALAAARLGVTTPADRRSMERLISAFTGQILNELGTADGAVDADEHEHGAGFSSQPGGPGVIERLRIGAEAGPLAAGRQARSQQSRVAAAPAIQRGVALGRMALKRADLMTVNMEAQRSLLNVATGPEPLVDATVEVREVERPAPRYYLPLDPLIAIRGAKRSLRYRGDGRHSPDGRLQCLWPSQVITKAQGTLDGADYIASLGNGAIPDEVLLLARNALVQNPFFVPWLAGIEAKRRGVAQAVAQNRLAAEAAIRYSPAGVYDGGSAAFTGAGAARSSSIVRAQIGDQLRRFSLFSGVDADPVGVTVWAQPWIPMWLEWEVVVQSRDRLDGWTLGPIDLDTNDPAANTASRTFQGRSLLHGGTAQTLAAAIEAWLTTEEQRDLNNQGETDAQTEAALRQIADGIGNLDILSTMLDGFSARFLGLPVDALGILSPRNADGSVTPPTPVDVPQLLLAGVLRLTRARIVDAFGRTLDLPMTALHVPERDEITTPAEAMALRPRLLRPARWLFRLVDPSLADITPGSDNTGPAEATIDEIEPAKMINPVTGFLLPDHFDDSLEAFDTAGQPLGQLMHEPFGGGVTWEIAPLRPGPADAGPAYGLGPAQRIVGLIATGMIAADAQQRKGDPAPLETESALSAFLRVVDTTLWTVDTFAQFGNEHIAGLVGRPIAVVRATLRLDIQDDLDQLQFSSQAQKDARAAAYTSLADRAFPVRLGELTRSDDGLFGYFVDDDYSEFHVVDKVIRDSAFNTGPGKGQLAQLGSNVQVPDRTPIDHPYIAADDIVFVHPGQLVKLTLLMHPASKVHLTSGVLPRKSLQLTRDWVAPGLAVISPSVRVGPVLVDPDKISLPKISSFPKDQVWIRRDTPNSWKTDPILAATQTAFFPDMPSDVQEGYIRIAQTAPGSQA